jgi:hypothetical protein
MNHFIYEIDERKLKLIFQEMEEPLPADAWDQFQATGAKDETTDSIQLPEISLNRTAVLALGFVVLAGLMALGIYKIIQIDPTGQSPAPMQAVVPSADSDASVARSLNPLLPTHSTAKVQKDTLPRLPRAAVNTTVAIATASSQDITPKEKQKDSTVSLKKSIVSEKESTNDSVLPRKKKSKKRSEKSTIEPEVLQDIRPLPPPPVEEQEIKIN